MRLEKFAPSTSSRPPRPRVGGLKAESGDNASGESGFGSFPTKLDELRRLRLLEGVSDAQLSLLLGRLKPRPTEAHEILHLRSEGEQSVFFAWSGKYRVTLMSPSGVHVCVRAISPGDQFGEASVLSSLADHDFHVIVDSGGMLLELKHDAFLQLVGDAPSVSALLLRQMADMVIERGERIFEFAALDMRLRLQVEILRLARNGEHVVDGIRIRPAPTHESLASRIGVTREGVTRQIRTLVNQGLIATRRGEIVITDLDRIRATVERGSGLRF